MYRTELIGFVIGIFGILALYHAYKHVFFIDSKLSFVKLKLETLKRNVKDIGVQNFDVTKNGTRNRIDPLKNKKRTNVTRKYVKRSHNVGNDYARLTNLFRLYPINYYSNIILSNSTNVHINLAYVHDEYMLTFNLQHLSFLAPTNYSYYRFFSSSK